MLEDDQLVDTHHDRTSLDDERSTCEAVDPPYPGDESPKFSGGCADSCTDDGKHTPVYSAKCNTDNRANHGQQEGNKSHDKDAVHTRALAGDDGDNDCSGSGADSDSPASVGRIHDVFAEYEETFGLRKSKQKAAHSTLPDCTEREAIGGSLPRDVLQEELRVATDVEQAAEAAGDDVARLSKREIGSGPIFQPRQEIDGLEMKTEEIRSQGIHTLAGDCHSGK